MGSVTSVAVGFRTLQAIHDLVALAQLAPEATVRRLAAGTPPADLSDGRALSTLIRLIHDDRCVFRDQESLALHETLLLAATLPDDDYPAFTLATCILLADRLQGGPGPDDLRHHWEALEPQYGLAAGPWRSAMRNGFRAMVEEGQLPASKVAPLLMSDVESDRVLADLRALGWSAGPPVLVSVAPGREAELQAIISQQGGILTPDQTWDIGEALGNAAFEPAHPGFLLATALLLATAIDRGDPGAGGFARRWEQFGGAYEAFPPPARWAVLSGLRYLYETDPAFRPWPHRQFDPADRGARLLPLLTLEDRPLAPLS